MRIFKNSIWNFEKNADEANERGEKKQQEPICIMKWLACGSHNKRQMTQCARTNAMLKID